MTNHLFELAGNRKTETVIPKSKKKWYQGKPVVSAAITPDPASIHAVHIIIANFFINSPLL